MITKSLLNGGAVTKISVGRARRWAHIANRSDATILLKYDGSDTALAEDNGIQLAAGAILMLNNSGHDQEFFHDIFALYMGVGNKAVVVHEG